MSETTATPEPLAQAAEQASEQTTPETVAALSAKEQIYVMLAEIVKTKTGKNIGKSGGRELFDTAIEQMFGAIARNTEFRLNGGFGSFHMKTYQAGSRRLPSGAETTFGERNKARYEEGVVVKELIKNGGDLVKAIEVGRGKRGSKTETPAPAPASAKAQKVAVAAPAAVATEENSGDVDLD